MVRQKLPQFQGTRSIFLKRKIGDASWGEVIYPITSTSKLEEGPIRATGEMWDCLCLLVCNDLGGITWLKWWKDLPTCIGYHINSHFIFNPHMSGFLVALATPSRWDATKIAVLKLLQGFEPESTETMPGLAFCMCKCAAAFLWPNDSVFKTPIWTFWGLLGWWQFEGREFWLRTFAAVFWDPNPLILRDYFCHFWFWGGKNPIPGTEHRNPL